MYRRLSIMLAVFTFVATGNVWARPTRIDKDLNRMAQTIAKDRQNAMHDEKHMSVADFKNAWHGFGARVDSLYAGRKVQFRSNGQTVAYRQHLGLALFYGLRFQTEVDSLAPSPQTMVAQTPFLQDILLNERCYYNDQPYPVRLRDLLKAQPMILAALREDLSKWAKGYRKNFEHTFPSRVAGKP